MNSSHTGISLETLNAISDKHYKKFKQCVYFVNTTFIHFQVFQMCIGG